MQNPFFPLHHDIPRPQNETHPSFSFPLPFPRRSRQPAAGAAKKKRSKPSPVASSTCRKVWNTAVWATICAPFRRIPCGWWCTSTANASVAPRRQAEWAKREREFLQAGNVAILYYVRAADFPQARVLLERSGLSSPVFIDPGKRPAVPKRHSREPHSPAHFPVGRTRKGRSLRRSAGQSFPLPTLPGCHPPALSPPEIALPAPASIRRGETGSPFL